MELAAHLFLIMLINVVILQSFYSGTEIAPVMAEEIDVHDMDVVEADSHSDLSTQIMVDLRRAARRRSRSLKRPPPPAANRAQHMHFPPAAPPHGPGFLRFPPPPPLARPLPPSSPVPPPSSF